MFKRITNTAVQGIRKIIIGLIKLYQYLISPLLPQTCRFEPCCSQYATEAIVKFGVLHGLYLSLRRLLRCQPFNKGGYDPLPSSNRK